MISIIELQDIQKIIYNPKSSHKDRSLAEAKLDNLENAPGSWRIFLHLLPNVDDQSLFLICLSLNKVIWRTWSGLQEAEQSAISQTVIELLVRKFFSLQLYARSKLEQVLATICKIQVSYNVLFKLLDHCDQSTLQGRLIPASAFRTTLDEVLGVDSRVAPKDRTYLGKSAFDISPQLTVLACQICVESIQTETFPSSGASSNIHSECLSTSLQMLKVIVTKVPVGPHITLDVLHLLFAVAELSASSPNPTASHNQASLSAVETLTELMTKRYIPNEHGGKDALVAVLLDMVAKAVVLIKKHCMRGEVEESPIVLSLLLFVSAFTECHLERLVDSASATDATADAVQGLFRELVILTLCSSEPLFLWKVSEMWLTLSSQRTLLSSPAMSEAALPLLGHLLTQSGARLNTDLFECLRDLEEDLPLDPLSNPRIRDLVANASTESSVHSGANCNGASRSRQEHRAMSPRSQIEGAEEHACSGTSLRSVVSQLVTALSEVPGVTEWLSTYLPSQVQNAVGALDHGGEAGASAAMDLCLYVRLLPLCVPSPELFPQLCALLQSLVEQRAHSRGKSFIGLIVVLVEVCSQIAQSLSPGQGASGAKRGLGTLVGLGQVAQSVPSLLAAVTAACDVTVGPAPFPVMVSVTGLLLQCLATLDTHIDQVDGLKAQVLERCVNIYLPRVSMLPIEVHALLVCCTAQVMPNLTRGLADRLHEATLELCSNETAVEALIEGPRLTDLSRCCACLDALARHHSLGTAAQRQLFVGEIGSLQECVGPLARACLSALQHVSGLLQAQAMSAAALWAKHHSLLGLCSIVISLVCGLQQSLGKKAFGLSSVAVLQACVEHVTTAQGPCVMQSHAGVYLVRLMLHLSSAVALSSSAAAPSAVLQAQLTERLIGFVCVYLTDTQICAELLQDTIKAGRVAIGCYWSQKRARTLTGGLLPREQGDTDDPPAVLPIGLQLTQLFVGSLQQSIAPQDAQTAIEGMYQLNELHNLFSADWFQSGGCWVSVIDGCLRALLTASQPTLVDGLLELLSNMQKSDLSVGPLSGGYWHLVGTRVYALSAELGVADQARYMLEHWFHNRGVQQGGSDIPVSDFVDSVLQPLAAEVSKRK